MKQISVAIYRRSDKTAKICGISGREQHLYFQATAKPQIKGCRYQPKGISGYYSIPLAEIESAKEACEINGIKVTKVLTDQDYWI